MLGRRVGGGFRSATFEGPGATRLGPAELVVAVTAPPPPSRSGLSYQYLSERGRVDISAVGVAVFVALTEDGVCEHVRIALGGVAPTPVRVSHAEGLLQGLVWRDPKAMEVVDRAAAAAADAARPINDVRASAVPAAHGAGPRRAGLGRGAGAGLG